MKESIIMPDGSYIPEPDYFKCLGVLFDNKLTFKRHTDIICCKINRIVGILWKNEHLNIEAKKMICQSRRITSLLRLSHMGLKLLEKLY